MADTNKKEYTSNLHPKGDLDTTVYPNVKSENIIDKDTTAYTAGKVPDSSLVSKSLDRISENLETTKIQVATNKKNIETLQGNYTEVQSQANTNSSDIALLKTNTIKKDTDASLKSLTLPSASDLKTKDGTSFGGGDTSSIPTDINIDKNFKLILEHDGVEITGQNKKIIYPFSISAIGNIFFTYLRAKIDNNYFFPFSFLFDVSKKYTNFKIESVYDKGIVYLITYDKSMEIFGQTYSSIGEFSFQNGNDAKKASLVILPNDTSADIYYVLPKDKSGTLALTSDLDAKQDKRFLHTVEIHYASNGSYFCFTGTSDKNTPIDSVQDLTTVFANRDLGGVGIFGSAGLSKIHVGTSVNDTTFKKYMNNGEYTNPSEETFATVFNPTGFTITDSVIPL